MKNLTKDIRIKFFDQVSIQAFNIINRDIWDDTWKQLYGPVYKYDVENTIIRKVVDLSR